MLLELGIVVVFILSLYLIYTSLILLKRPKPKPIPVKASKPKAVSNNTFDIKHIPRPEERPVEFTLIPIDEIPKHPQLTRDEILNWTHRYDEDHPWWTEEEQRIGVQLRQDKEFGLDTLKEIIHWKFYTLPGREKRTLNLIKDYTDEDIRRVSKLAFNLSIKQEKKRIEYLSSLKGIGVALSSTILTFLNPNMYCVYDIHVMRSLYGEEPKYMFTGSKHYLRLLNDIRKIAKEYDLPVRTIEKAYFKKNIE